MAIIEFVGTGRISGEVRLSACDADADCDWNAELSFGRGKC